MDFTITDRKSIQVKRKSLIQERQKKEEQKIEPEALRKDMVAAMKAKDKVTKEAVSALIAAVKKAAIDEGCRDDIKGELVDKVILKELKTAKEQIDTCPAERTSLTFPFGLFGLQTNKLSNLSIFFCISSKSMLKLFSSFK